MIQITATLKGIGRIERVSKNVARRFFCQGKTIYLHPCNFMPCDSGWTYPCQVSNEEVAQFDYDDNQTPNTRFERIVNQFEYYNCTCAETGTYAAYYVITEIDTKA